MGRTVFKVLDFERSLNLAKELTVPRTQHAHKSTTHEEKFFHFQTPDSPYFRAITVFARKESDGAWYSTPGMCSWDDEFTRKLGRTVSRRRYFQRPEKRVKLTGPDEDIDFNVLRDAILDFSAFI